MAEQFVSLGRIANTSEEDLMAVADIGPIVAKSIYKWFHDKTHQKMLDKFKKNGLEVLPYRAQHSRGKLYGKIFVLTGSLENMSREEAKARIRSLGGKTSESVSQETSFVVAGNEPGSKYDKAKKIGVAVVDEAEFLKMLK